eukprot:16228199-Heterocapsa_arctica.AAC.1
MTEGNFVRSAWNAGSSHRRDRTGFSMIMGMPCFAAKRKSRSAQRACRLPFVTRSSSAGVSPGRHQMLSPLPRSGGGKPCP